MKAYLMQVVVVDFEGVGAEDVRAQLEQMKHISPDVLAVEELDIGEWSDDHPLNGRVSERLPYVRRHRGLQPQENDPAYFDMDKPALIRALWVTDDRLIQVKKHLRQMAGELELLAGTSPAVANTLRALARAARHCADPTGRDGKNVFAPSVEQGRIAQAAEETGGRLAQLEEDGVISGLEILTKDDQGVHLPRLVLHFRVGLHHYNITAEGDSWQDAHRMMEQVASVLEGKGTWRAVWGTDPVKVRAA